MKATNVFTSAMLSLLGTVASAQTLPEPPSLWREVTGVAEVGRDLAQDSMVQAFRRWPTVGALDSPGGWTRRVTINAAMSWHRSQRRSERLLPKLIERPISGDAAVEGEQFWAAVRALPDRQRAVVALYYLHDQSVAEVAATLDIAPGTVKATLHSARRSLTVALGLDEGDRT